MPALCAGAGNIKEKPGARRILRLFPVLNVSGSVTLSSTVGGRLARSGDFHKTASVQGAVYSMPEENQILTLARLRLGSMNHNSTLVVYFPLGFTNRSGFKSGLLTQARVSLVRGEASLVFQILPSPGCSHFGGRLEEAQISPKVPTGSKATQGKCFLARYAWERISSSRLLVRSN
uniref:Uncharacterized protein n=1 Tax=Candidatus Kentrum sp. SD TaxID=2126332 RepID=A0A451BIJ3_9GAMM|nr:MAG: hypothetical protein BECKSD772D_GA0070982_100727 [Candidatus Kentron sp. SD]